MFCRLSNFRIIFLIKDIDNIANDLNKYKKFEGYTNIERVVNSFESLVNVDFERVKKMSKPVCDESKYITLFEQYSAQCYINENHIILNFYQDRNFNLRFLDYEVLKIYSKYCDDFTIIIEKDEDEIFEKITCSNGDIKIENIVHPFKSAILNNICEGEDVTFGVSRPSVFSGAESAPSP